MFYLPECPEIRANYFADERLLRLPYVGIYNRQRDLSARQPRPPIGEFNVSLELLEGANGQLLFNVHHISPASP